MGPFCAQHPVQFVSSWAPYVRIKMVLEPQVYLSHLLVSRPHSNIWHLGPLLKLDSCQPLALLAGSFPLFKWLVVYEQQVGLALRSDHLYTGTLLGTSMADNPEVRPLTFIYDSVSSGYPKTVAWRAWCTSRKRSLLASHVPLYAGNDMCPCCCKAIVAGKGGPLAVPCEPDTDTNHFSGWSLAWSSCSLCACRFSYLAGLPGPSSCLPSYCNSHSQPHPGLIVCPVACQHNPLALPCLPAVWRQPASISQRGFAGAETAACMCCMEPHRSPIITTAAHNTVRVIEFLYCLLGG